MARILSLNTNLQRAIHQAVLSLKETSLIIYPTDTLYGLGCDAQSEKAIQKIYDLKKRPSSLPLSVMFPTTDSLKKYSVKSPIIDALITTFLPGALTLVLPVKPGLFPDILYSEDGYIGMRVPNHPFCLGMKNHFENGIITTSVNLSSETAMTKISQMTALFGDSIGSYIKDDNLELQTNHTGSTILKCHDSGKITLLREGKIPFKKIQELEHTLK